MLHLYEATVCTTMMVVAKSRDAAVKTAKIYAEDEISISSKVSLADINHPSLLPDEWGKLYPYIANKCIDKQMTCRDLVRLIAEQISNNPPKQEEEPNATETETESQETPEIQEPSPSQESEVVTPNKEEQVPQPGRAVKSPKRKDLPQLRFQY